MQCAMINVLNGAMLSMHCGMHFPTVCLAVHLSKCSRSSWFYEKPK